MRGKHCWTIVELAALTGVAVACLCGGAAYTQSAPETPRVALQSVYYYTFRPTQTNTPGEPHPPPLSEAVKVLKNDESPDGIKRRHLAIAKLVGGSELRKSPSGPVQLQPQDLSTAVNELAGGDTSKILDELTNLPSQASREQKEKAAFAALGQGVTTAPGSCPAVPGCPDPTSVGGAVHINFKVNVALPFKQVIRAMYPRFWGKCDSTFFGRTYAALRDPDTTYHRDPRTGDAVEDPNQPVPTTPGKRQKWVLFEHFRIEATQVSFKNLLDISEEFVAADTYVLKYKLHESINHNFGGTQEPRGITTDEGFTKIVAFGPNDTLFIGDKKIQFDDPSLNRITQNVIHGICNEAAGQGVGTGVCCDPDE